MQQHGSPHHFVRRTPRVASVAECLEHILFAILAYWKYPAAYNRTVKLSLHPHAESCPWEIDETNGKKIASENCTNKSISQLPKTGPFSCQRCILMPQYPIAIICTYKREFLLLQASWLSLAVGRSCCNAPTLRIILKYWGRYAL